MLHDTRLGALVAVLLGVALVVAPRPGGAAARPRWPVLLGGGVALVVGNAVVAPLLGPGPADVVVGAAGLLALTAAGCAAGAACSAARPRRAPSSASELHLTWCLLLAGAAAGTAGALGIGGLGDGWGYLLVRSAAAAAALAAAALTAVAVLAVLEARGVSPWWRWPLAAAAAVPGAVGVVVLLTDGPLEGLIASPLVVVLLPGGLLSMALTAPAGAEIGVDGLPLVGGGALVGLLVGLVVAALAVGTTDELAAARAADATGDEPAGLR